MKVRKKQKGSIEKGSGKPKVSDKQRSDRPKGTDLLRTAANSPVRPGFVLPLISLTIALLVLLIYWQVGEYFFVSFDDGVYVSLNPAVLKGITRESMSWAFTTFHAANWHPLTWLSHMLDVELFGLSRGWHHRMNVLYHLLNTELLLFVLWRMTGGLWQSAIVAALFGVHPLHVESVAWVAERKDLLSTLFFLMAIGAYVRYIRKPGLTRYLLVMLSFSLGLMSKPMLVTLPFVLLLLDFWPLRRMTPVIGSSPGAVASATYRLVLEKVPLMGLSAIACVITLLAQARGGAVQPLDKFPLGLRISNALVSYAAYLEDTLWPSALAVFYSHPATSHALIPVVEVAGAVFLIAGISFLVFRQRVRRPHLIVGWLWYLGTLVPVIGVVQVGMAARSDRYTYIPLIGLFIAVAWSMGELLENRRLRIVTSGGILCMILILSAVAWRQAGYWSDSVTLWSRTAAVTENNWTALNNLGAAKYRLGRYEEAIGHYREALRIRPDYAEAWYNMGTAYQKLGQIQQAIECYRKALRIRPDSFEALNNLGVIHDGLGQHQQAVADYREALRINPNYVAAWNNLGGVLQDLGQGQQARECFLKALQIDPENTEAKMKLGESIGDPFRHGP